MWKSAKSLKYNTTICQDGNDTRDIGYGKSKHRMLSWCRRWDWGNPQITAAHVKNESAVGFAFQRKAEHITIKSLSFV